MKLPRNAQIWALPYCAQRTRTLFGARRKITRVWLCIADHYEPFWGKVSADLARQRVHEWWTHWPEVAARAPLDSGGCKPQYTFFYPEEEYTPELLDRLADMKQQGIADVEVHIHHDGDSRATFMRTMERYCRLLHDRHGFLRVDGGRLRFGFIHGNWALDNSLPSGKWCGVNDEISALRDLGCYADFTMPSGDSPTQAHIVNSIYWCKDDPLRPKSYDRGIPVVPGGGVEGDLLMITGPIGMRWSDRLFPRMEAGEISAGDLATAYRVRRWFELAPMIGTDLFVKLHTHGAQERNMGALLQGGLEDLFATLKKEATSRGCEYHYVTAWQMYLAADALRRQEDPLQAVRGTRSAGLSDSKVQ